MKILYEDNHIIVVVKPCNIPSNLDESNDLDMLTMIKDYIKEKYNKPGNVYLGLVHRLDRPVSGVMVYAKTSKAASRLSDSLRKNEFHKTYLAVCQGVSKPIAHLENYLVKDSKTNMVKVTSSDKGKLAILDYKTLQQIDDLSLVEVDLQTGRSHQIRVQLSNAKIPLWGDQRYNKNSKVGQQIALFAYKLTFPHPTTKEMMTFVAYPNPGKPWSNFNLER